MSKLDKFAIDIEAAFTLIGGEQTKASYDWMIATQERDRIIKLLIPYLQAACQFPMPINTARELLTLIKEETE